MKKPLKKSVKVVLIIVVSLLILLAAALVFTQTSLFRSIVLNKVLEQANNYLNAELTIESLRGNFFSNLSIHDITLKYEDKKMLSIAELSLKYNLTGILRKRISIESIRIESPEIWLRETDSEWNFADMIKEQPRGEPKTVSEDEKGFDWSILLKSFVINNGEVNLSTEDKDDTLPTIMENINLEASASTVENKIDLSLDKLITSLNWDSDHGIEINRTSLALSLQGDILTVEDFSLRTAYSELQIAGNLNLRSNDFDLTSRLKLENFRDLTFFIPELNPEHSMELTSKITSVDGEINSLVELTDDSGSLTIDVEMRNLPIAKQTEDPSYRVIFAFSEFKPYLFLKEEIPKVALNGSIDIEGKGFDYQKAEVIAKINFQDLLIDSPEHLANPLVVSNLNVHAELKDNSLNSTLSISAPDAVNADVELSVRNISEQEGILLTGDFYGINLETFLNEEQYNSDLNFNVRAETSDWEKMPIDLELTFLESRFSEIDFDELFFIASLHQDMSIDLDILRFEIAENILEAKGFLSQNDPSDFTYMLKLTNVSNLLSPWVEDAEDISISAQIEGSIKGKIGELSGETTIEIVDSNYDEIALQELNGNITFNQQVDSLIIDGDINIKGFSYGDYAIEEVTILGDFDGDSGNISLSVKQSSDLEIDTIVELFISDDQIEVHWTEFTIVIEDDHWSFSQDDTFVKYDDGIVTVNNFMLSSGSQSIAINGIVSMSGSNSLELEIDRLDLLPILEHLDIEAFTSGNLDLSLNLAGTSENPEININLYLDDVTFNELSNLSLLAELTYDPELEEIITVLDLKREELLIINTTAYIPMSLSMSTGAEIDKNKSGTVSFTATDIDLNLLSGITEDVRNIEGRLNADLRIDDLFTDTTLSGMASISDASFHLPDLGTSYREFSLLIELNEKKLELKELHGKSGQGTVNATGEFTLDDEDEFKLSQIKLNVNLNDFPIISTSALDIVVNSRLDLSGSSEAPVFGGFVNISRGRVNLDHLPEGEISESSDPPLLVKARRQDKAEEDVVEPESSEPMFDLTALRGEMNLRFPRNFWLRSADMNIEIRADIDIVKRDAHFELFGSINTVRGFYVFFGKKFQIEEGDIIFSGGREINPDLTVSAMYTFRGIDQTRNKLKLMVTGTLEQLNISFELNDQPIEESDAISYILFGRSFDQLTQGEKSEATNHALVIGGLLANRLANQLSSVLGDRFHLDQLEISSDTATSQIGIEVGKYITDKLFISFKRDFNIGDTREQVYEEFLVEYEITRYLYLQAIKSDARTTGVDFIWRFQWK